MTYYRSRNARMEESKSAGGGDFYDRVYHATRPELFFKSMPHRVVGPGAKVAIRDDASWSVPEPELTLLVTPGGKIAGYTIGNDMSSRDIEGENPLYLPQAKVYDRSCALGPCLLIGNEPLLATTEIALEIRRGGVAIFSGATTLQEMKRKLEELVEYLYRNHSFPHGCFLLTGTGIVPPDSFHLEDRRRDPHHHSADWNSDQYGWMKFGRMLVLCSRLGFSRATCKIKDYLQGIPAMAIEEKTAKRCDQRL